MRCCSVTWQSIWGLFFWVAGILCLRPPQARANAGGRSVLQRCWRGENILGIILHQFFLSPPIIGMFIGLLIGMTPLQAACFPDSTKQEGPTACTPISGVIEMFANAAVACQNLVLAASLYQGMVLVRRHWRTRKEHRKHLPERTQVMSEVTAFGEGDAAVNYMINVEVEVHTHHGGTAGSSASLTDGPSVNGAATEPLPTPISHEDIESGTEGHTNPIAHKAQAIGTQTSAYLAKGGSGDDDDDGRLSIVGPGIGLLLSKLIISPLLYYAVYFGLNALDAPGLSVAGNSDTVFHIVILLEVSSGRGMLVAVLATPGITVPPLFPPGLHAFSAVYIGYAGTIWPATIGKPDGHHVSASLLSTAKAADVQLLVAQLLLDVCTVHPCNHRVARWINCISWFINITRRQSRNVPVTGTGSALAALYPYS